MAHIPDDLISTEAAAKLIGISPRAVRARVESGTLTPYHRGRRLMFSKAEVQAAIEELDPSPIAPVSPFPQGQVTPAAFVEQAREMVLEVIRTVGEELGAAHRQTLSEMSSRLDQAVDGQRREADRETAERQRQDEEIKALRADIEELKAARERQSRKSRKWWWPW